MRALARLLLGSAVVATFVGCGTSRPVRFDDGSVITRIDDTVPIPEPTEAEFHRFSHHIENFVNRQLRLGLDPMPAPPALDVNRWGDVPTSSWYVRRGELSPAQVEVGAGVGFDAPEAHFPWTITRVKSGGANPGFLFQDSRGEGFILKVDKPGVPIVATSAGAVANRLLWALGYRVPDDRIVIFDRSQLVLGAKARDKGITDADVDAVLEARASRMPDGRWRALTSRFLHGTPVGGYSYTGTREGDLNDIIDHERRRSLRAMRVFGAWLQHVDMKIDNTLDLYVRSDAGGHLEHYLVDFDGCLGGYWAARGEARIGSAYDLDLGELVRGLGLFGLVPRPYEHLEGATHPEIGLFESEVYDPATWTPNYVNDQLDAAGPADLFWAGTVLSKLRREHVEAAVRAGRYVDAEAERILADVLWRRWEKTVDWALLQVSPAVSLLPAEHDPSHLVIEAEDALLRAGRPSALRWQVEVLDEEGHVLHSATAETPAVDWSVDGPSAGDTVIVRWVALDGTRQLPESEAHYRFDDGRWRLAGILRNGE